VGYEGSSVGFIEYGHKSSLSADFQDPPLPRQEKITVKFYSFININLHWNNTLDDPELLLPWSVDCWLENMKLQYDSNARATSNAPGVETRY